MVVKSELEKPGLHFTTVELGEVEITDKITDNNLRNPGDRIYRI